MTGLRTTLVIGALIIAYGCARQPDTGRTAVRDTIATELLFLTREGCVNTQTMRANLDEALRTLGLPSDYQVVDLDTVRDGDHRRGYPTPTLLYDGHDIFGLPEPRPPFPDPT